jgi:hypothetical protein
MATEARTKQGVAGKSRTRTRLLTIAAAVVAAVAVWGIATAAGAELEVDQGFGVMAINAGSVIFSVLLAGFAGWGILALLERRSPRGASTWTIIAVAVLVLSFLPIAFVEATAGTRVALAAMHLTVAAVIIPIFRRTSRSA